jgi:hypothetical protein
MISAARWNHTIRAFTSVGRIGIAALMVSLPVSTARGSQQERISESRVSLPASRPNEFAGEIEYAFDTALNRTTALFRAPLGSRRLLARMFTGAPVHTIVATYQFGGRAAIDRPDSIRFSLMSDEYVDGAPDYRPTFGAQPPILLIIYDDAIARYNLGVAQRTEMRSAHETYARVNQTSSAAAEARINFSGVATQVHIERTATAWIPVCEFIAIVDARIVHGTVADLDFDLNEDVISGLRQFAAKMAPSLGGIRASCGSR